jgi:adenylate cyclase
MFTDIVGSTSVMQHNEVKAVTLSRRYVAVLKEYVSQYQGQVLNDYGDGSLCIFSSVKNALLCAKDMQLELQREPQVPLRIGLHIGEIFFEEGKIYGDGVNVASRIQSLGQANTVLFSWEVMDKIKNHPEIKAVSLGQFTFKNVDDPVEVFALADEGLFVPKRNKLEGKVIKNKEKNRKVIALLLLILASVLTLSYFLFVKKPIKNADRSSIAIIPFHNQALDKTLDSYCYGLASEIRTQLSLNNQFEFISSDQATYKYKDSKLSPSEMGNELDVDYVLLGSVYKMGGKLKITVELADGKNGKSIWSLPPYLSTLSTMEDLFSVQSSIAQKVLEKFSFEKKYSSSIPTVSLPAYNYYLKARESLGGWNMKLSIEFFEKAIQLDSNFLSAYQGLIFAKALLYWNYGSDTVKRERELKPYIDQIDQKFPNSWETYLAKGSYYYHGLKDYQSGLEFCQKALAIETNSEDACHLIAGINRRLLNSKEALFYNRKIIDFDPSNTIAWRELGLILSDNGNFSDALKVYSISMNLGMNEELIANDILGIENENGTIDELGEELKKYFGIKFQAISFITKRDWQGVLRIANSPEQNQAYSPIERTIDKAYAYHFLGEKDSAIFYSSLALQSKDSNYHYLKIEDMVAMQGDNKTTIDFFHNTVEKYNPDHDGQDLLQICDNTKALIQLLAFIGEYKQSVELLINLNKKYPVYGNYGALYTDFHYDRIKKEYPPFNEALKNLKLPPRIDVSDVFKKVQAK